VVRHLSGVAQGGRHRAGVGVGDEAQVRKEHHVELAALAHAGDVLVELRPRPVVAGGRGAGMPPHGQAVIGGGVHQELREVHHLGRHHRLPRGADPSQFRRHPIGGSGLKELYPIWRSQRRSSPPGPSVKETRSARRHLDFSTESVRPPAPGTTAAAPRRPTSRGSAGPSSSMASHLPIMRN
jgi:hypothetical protein